VPRLGHKPNRLGKENELLGVAFWAAAMSARASLFALLLLTVPAHADVYSLSSAFGPVGLSGTITTDGAQGNLSPSDITDWSITMHSPDPAWATRTDYDITFTPSNSYIGYPFGPDLVADAAGLHWSFNARDGQLFEMQPLSAGLCGCWFDLQTRWGDEPDAVIQVHGSNYYMTEGAWNFDPQGNFSSGLIATSVPEPSTWALMLIGFASLGFAVRKSRRKTSFA
jgi:hypothetical protein